MLLSLCLYLSLIIWAFPLDQMFGKWLHINNSPSPFPAYFYTKVSKLGECRGKFYRWNYQSRWKIPLLIDFLVMFYE